MRYKENARYVNELRELADFLEQHGVELPDYWMSNTLHVPLTETEYVSSNTPGEYETKIKEYETKRNIKRFLSAVGSCEKDYREDRIRITKRYSDGNRDMVVGTADRSVACKRVVTGKKFVKEQLIPSKFEEEYEWVCDEGLSLKNLVRNI
jgi:hypothetical protein